MCILRFHKRETGRQAKHRGGHFWQHSQAVKSTKIKCCVKAWASDGFSLRHMEAPKRGKLGWGEQKCYTKKKNTFKCMFDRAWVSLLINTSPRSRSVFVSHHLSPSFCSPFKFRHLVRHSHRRWLKTSAVESLHYWQKYAKLAISYL